MPNEIYQKTLTFLRAHRAEILADIKRLVDIKSQATYDEPPTPFGHGCKAVLAEALKLGEERGFIARDYGDMCGCLTLGETEPFIGFWGHLDVVPEGDVSIWLFPPYAMTEKDGFIIGRGVGDNKGPAVGTMWVILALKEMGVELRHSLRLFLGVDEEHGMRDAIWYSDRYPSGDLTLIADSGFPVSYGEKGMIGVDLIAKEAASDILSLTGGIASNVIPAVASCVIRNTPKAAEAIKSLPADTSAEVEAEGIRFTSVGRAAHSAGPENGVNAIWRLMRALVDTRTLPEDDEKKIMFLAGVNDGFHGETLGNRLRGRHFRQAHLRGDDGVPEGR